MVVDSQISTAGQVEMYADPGARGGVLEPEGVCEIKFRDPDLVKMMHRWAAGSTHVRYTVHACVYSVFGQYCSAGSSSR